MSPSRHVAVTSDQSLVGDTVAAALVSSGLRVTRVGWHAGGPRMPRTGEPIDVGVLLCDLESLPRVEQAQAVVRRVLVPWIVLTGSRPGPLWGAMLEAGAVAVLRSSCSLEALREAIERVAAGEQVLRPAELAGLRASWRAVDREGRSAVNLVRSLTPRETEVLALMHDGESVQQIAQHFGVSESTVRSQVRAVLRKLEVNTQLAAVAAYESASKQVRASDADR